MMNSISRPMAFMLAVAAIAAATITAANSAGAQQAAVEGGALAACANRAAPPSPHADEGNKDSTREADSYFDKLAVRAMSKEGRVRRTSASVVSAAENDSGEPAEELSSRPQACYPPAPARKIVDR